MDYNKLTAMNTSWFCSIVRGTMLDKSRCLKLTFLFTILLLSTPLSSSAESLEAIRPSDDFSLASSFRYEDGVDVSASSADENSGVVLFSRPVAPSGARSWGIDVSYANKNIDWRQVKADGVDFALIRSGFGWGGGDDQFENNVRGCKDNGIPFGIYHYSYAWDASSSRSEATWCLSQLQRAGASPSDLSLPVFYDLENERDGRPCGIDDNSNRRYIDGGPSVFADMARSFCDTVANAGYSTGVYANLKWWRNYLTDPYFSNVEKWVAQYNRNLDYIGDCAIWQYSSSGSVSGVNGRVDVNWSYRDWLSDSRAAAADKMAREHVDDIKDGSFSISPAASADFSLDVKNGYLNRGSIVQLWRANGTDAQVWSISHDGPYVVIKNLSSGLALDVCNGKNQMGNSLQLYPYNGTRAQKWIAIAQPDGSFYFRSALDPDMCIDLRNGAMSSGATIQLHMFHGASAQRWRAAPTLLLSQEADNLAKKHASDLEDGQYCIKSSKSSSKVFDCVDGRTSSGTRIQVFESNLSDAQVWTVAHEGDYVTICNTVSGRRLEVANGNAYAGASLQLYDSNGTRAQKWIAIKHSDGYELVSALDPRYSIDLKNGSISDGTSLQLWSSNSTPAQRWSVSKASTLSQLTDAYASNHGTVLSSGVYELIPAYNNDFSVDVKDGKLSSGSPVQLWSSNGTDAQKWRIDKADPYITISNAQSGLSLDVKDGLSGDGASLQLWSKNGTRAQKWILEKTKDDSFVLRSALDYRKVIDVSGGNFTRGNVLQLWEANGTKAQAFQLRLLK